MRRLCLLSLLALGCEHRIEVGTTDSGHPDAGVDAGAAADAGPPAPTLEPLLPGLRSLTVEWLAPSPDDGVTAWRLRRSTGSPARVDERLLTRCCSLELDGLDAGEASTVTLTALSDAGESAPSASMTGVPSALGLAFERKADLPTARLFPAMVTHAGHLFAIGGSVPDGGGLEALDVNEEYDPVADRWTVRAPMPTPRAGAGAVEVNGLLYVMGGTPSVPANMGVSSSRAVETYDPAMDSWSPRAPLPMDLQGCLLRTYAAAVAGRIYLWPCTSMLPLQIYDPATDSWSTGATPPSITFNEADDYEARGGSVFTLSRAGYIEYVVSSDYYVVRPNVPQSGVIQGEGRLASTTSAMFALFCAPGPPCFVLYRDEAASDPLNAWPVTSAGPPGRSEYGVAASGDTVFVAGGFHDVTASEFVPTAELYVGTVQR